MTYEQYPYWLKNQKDKAESEAYSSKRVNTLQDLKITELEKENKKLTKKIKELEEEIKKLKEK